MRTARLAGALAVLLGVVLAWAPAGASFSSTATRDESPLVLRGSISMSSTGSSYVLPVILPRQVTITMDTDMHVQARRGRFPGFILRKDGPGLQQSASDFLAHGCLSEGCQPPHYPFFDSGPGYALVTAQTTDASLRTGIFPPGRYHLFVVADGAPMRATLRLHGLSGRLAVRSGSALLTTVSVPLPSVFSPPAASPSPGELYSAGSTHHMPSTSGFFFDMVYKVMTGYSVSEVGACRFDGPPDSNVLGPYQYPCSTPTGPVEAGWDVLALQGVNGALATGTSGGPAGLVPEYVTALWYWGPFTTTGRVISLGGYIDSASPAVSAHVLTLWVDFTGEQLRGKPWKLPPPRSGPVVSAE
jgi:hypothetical protein